ncbi:MAG: hypothetical protein OHK0013_21230 [Sandaracinaceae bacterium]
MRRAFPLVHTLAALCFAGGLSLPLASSSARAQELSRGVRARCIASIVRIEVDTPRGTLSGSGTIVDPRGYVLTNFHVVGHTDHRGGAPGTHHARRYRVALVRGERDEVRDDFVAEVVRGSVPLDLALLRIVERADGSPIGAGETFQAMAIAEDLPELGTRVWALGFPAGVRTVNITAGQIAGFEQNAHAETAWLRTDTEFNPGNSGGALVDRDCRLIGVPTAVSDNVEPIELARPATRIPARWREALRTGGPVSAERTEGILALNSLTEVVDTHLGDAAGRSGELRFYTLPRARPAVVSVSPRLELAVLGTGGRILREGDGQVLVTASDPQSATLVVFVPRGQTGSFPRVRVRYAPMSAPASEAASGALLRGRLRLADGGACRTYAVLAPVGLDLGALTRELSHGAVSESEFLRRVRAVAAVGDDGTFALPVSRGAFVVGFVGPDLENGDGPTGPIELGDADVDVGEVSLGARCH